MERTKARRKDQQTRMTKNPGKEPRIMDQQTRTTEQHARIKDQLARIKEQRTRVNCLLNKETTYQDEAY